MYAATTEEKLTVGASPKASRQAGNSTPARAVALVILSFSQFSPRLKVLLIVFPLENVYELVAFGAELVFFAWVWSSSLVLAVDFD